MCFGWLLHVSLSMFHICFVSDHMIVYNQVYSNSHHSHQRSTTTSWCLQEWIPEAQTSSTPLAPLRSAPSSDSEWRHRVMLTSCFPSTRTPRAPSPTTRWGTIKTFQHILILVSDNLLGNDGYIDDLFRAGSPRRMGQLHVCDQKRPQSRREDGSRQSQLDEQRWIPWILDQIRKREHSCRQREWGMFIVT